MAFKHVEDGLDLAECAVVWQVCFIAEAMYRYMIANNAKAGISGGSHVSKYSHYSKCNITDTNSRVFLVLAEVYGFANAFHPVVANQLSSLLPSHAKDWWPMIEGVFSSPQVRGLRERLLQECIASEEFQCISVDATVRCCLQILGQARVKSLPSRRVCHCEENLG